MVAYRRAIGGHTNHIAVDIILFTPISFRLLFVPYPVRNYIIAPNPSLGVSSPPLNKSLDRRFQPVGNANFFIQPSQDHRLSGLKKEFGTLNDDLDEIQSLSVPSGILAARCRLCATHDKDVGKKIRI